MRLVMGGMAEGWRHLGTRFPCPARGAPIVEIRRRNDRREVPGRVGGPGGGNLRQASAGWHSAVIGKRPVGVSCF
jgi:hypothetical protein